MYNTRKAGQPLRRWKPQHGTVIKRKDGFFIRFYRDDENGQRTKVTEPLCDLTTSANMVKQKAVSHMSGVNGERLASLHMSVTEAPTTVGGFWTATYLPWAKQNLRASTADHYESDWRMYIKPELETQPINTYTTVQACELLDYMVTKKNLNKSTLAHVKSLCRGIFKHAVRKGIIKINPWREAGESVKVRPAKKRIAYTPEETVAILNALNKPDAKLFFAMCAILGMRPSEVAASKWENVTNGRLKIIEAAPYGVLGETKSKRSNRTIKINESVLLLISAWHEACGKPSAGLMFTNRKGEPVNSSSFAKYHIAPQAMEVCPRWCGLYAGRHGAFTTLFNETGDERAAYQRSGNSLEILRSTYLHEDVSKGDAGADVQEAALKAATNKALSNDVKK